MRLLVTRNWGGLGDWLMALAVLKMVNRQRPDVDIHVHFATSQEPLPSIVREAFAASDVCFDTTMPAMPYAWTGHFVYRGRRSALSWIEDMVEVLAERSGIRVRYEPGVYPAFTYPAPKRTGYVALIAHGKRKNRKKEWDGFQSLAWLLADRGVPLVQIGARGDEPLEAVEDRRLGEPFAVVAQTLAGARCFIGIENGLMVLAGFLGVPQITLYCGTGHPEQLKFAHQLQVREQQTPDYVASLIDSF